MKVFVHESERNGLRSGKTAPLSRLLVRSGSTPPRRTYYRRKLAAGKTRAEAMRCLKRRISDAIYRQLLADVRTFAPENVDAGPGGAPRGVT